MASSSLLSECRASCDLAPGADRGGDVVVIGGVEVESKLNVAGQPVAGDERFGDRIHQGIELVGRDADAITYRCGHSPSAVVVASVESGASG